MGYGGQFPSSPGRSKTRAREKDTHKRKCWEGQWTRTGLEQIKEELVYTDLATGSHKRDHRNQHTCRQSHLKTHLEELPQQRTRHLEGTTWTRQPSPTAWNYGAIKLLQDPDSNPDVDVRQREENNPWEERAALARKFELTKFKSWS